MATGNGLQLKGGKEAKQSNQFLMELVTEALATVNAKGAIALVTKVGIEEVWESKHDKLEISITIYI